MAKPKTPFRSVISSEAEAELLANFQDTLLVPLFSVISSTANNAAVVATREDF